MTSAATMRTSDTSPAASIAWWVGTWVAGVMAGSVALGVFHAPSRPEDPIGVGDVLAAPIGVLGLSLVSLWSAYLVGMWLASQRVGTADPRRDYGIRFAPFDLIGIPIGVAGQLGLVWLVYTPLRAVWPDTFGSDRLDDTARDLVDRADGASLLLLVVLVAVGAPIIEELFFRGMLQRPLIAAAGTGAHRVVAVAGVAVIFAAVHFRPVEFPGLLAIGLVLGVCAWRTDRLGMAILAHVAFNATGLLSVM
jgi:membrane protease YdiL (CAAX protease family)